MAYSDFSASDLKSKFGVKFSAKELFPNVLNIQPSAWLIEAIERGRKFGYFTEKSRSERLVSPILDELCNQNGYSFAILSGADLNVDRDKGLNGECDFIFSRSNLQDFVTAPIFCITEAKKQDIELGSIQCAAQLIGAKILNEKDGEEMPILYGCSTSGETWRFLKYENNEIVLDKDRYFIGDLPKILGILQEIVNRTKNDK